MNIPLITILIILSLSYSSSVSEALNVVDFGAKAGGSRDSTDAFLKTWNAACASTQPTSIVVPGGEFLIGEILFAGPCRNKNIQFQIEGSIVAPMDDSSFLNANAWITFESVDGLDINGGIINGRGNSIWACKNANHNSNNCQQGPRNLLFFKGNNINIKGLTTIDSNQFHIVIDSCTNVNVAGVHVIAPETSPNTDGIHVGKSTTVNITDCNIKTGDDCISIGPGTSGLFVGNCNCGPGHGISIGSLGSGEDDEKNDIVENIRVEGAVFTGTQNGVRIKTWGKPTTGNVNGVVFHHIIMQDVENPIIIDQEYCPAGNCNNQPSRIKIHDITFSDIRGTSSSLIAINFVCSSSTPCQDIKLIDVKLNPGKDVNGQALQSSCKNAQGSTSGDVAPVSCF